MDIFQANVLIVDDSRAFAIAFKDLIFDVVGDGVAIINLAHSADEAMELIVTKHYHYIFMDVQMPGTNGIELTRKLDRMFNGLNIIAISFHRDFEIIRSMIEAGARNYIVKEDVSPQDIERIFGLTQNSSSTMNESNNSIDKV